MSYGVVIVSHSAEIASGLEKLIREVASDISLTAIGGLENGEIGTSFDRVSAAIEDNSADSLLTFFDLGSARMNLDMVAEFTEKEILIFNVPLIEGAYTACALLQANAPIEIIKDQLKALEIEK